MSQLLAIHEPVNRIAELIEQIADEDEKRSFKRAFGEIMGRLWTDLEFEIVKQHPELDPDKDADWYRELRAKRSQRGEL